MRAVLLCNVANSEDVKKYSGLSVAGNKFLKGFIKHISKYFDDFEIISVPPIASFPKDKRLFFRKKYSNVMGVRNCEVSFINIAGIKQICQIVSCFKEGIKRINKDTVLITYNLYPQIGVPALVLQKMKACKSFSFIADLPIDNMVNRNGVSRLFFMVGNSLSKFLLSKAKNTIVLNEQAWIDYVSSSNHIVIDGGIDDDEFLNKRNKMKEYHYDVKNIVYSGCLDKYSGILNLIKAMQYVKNKDIVLDIYGDGEMRPCVEARSKGNVRFHGRISNKEVMEFQRRAWLLINPRPIDDPIARVTFPSKIFEYMTSGTPTISTRLNGFSEDYNGKIIFAENASPKELARCINQVDKMSDEDLSIMANVAFEYIGEKKLWSFQCKKIFDFIINECI